MKTLLILLLFSLQAHTKSIWCVKMFTIEINDAYVYTAIYAKGEQIGEITPQNEYWVDFTETIKKLNLDGSINWHIDRHMTAEYCNNKLWEEHYGKKVL